MRLQKAKLDIALSIIDELLSKVLTDISAKLLLYLWTEASAQFGTKREKVFFSGSWLDGILDQQSMRIHPFLPLVDVFTDYKRHG